jgi:hypothetical protein
MHVAAKLAVHAPAPDLRRANRADTNAAVMMETQGYFGKPVLLLDISESGFRVDAGAHIPPKSLVRLNLPGLGMVIGRIVWSRDGEVGGEFVNPVSPQRLMLIPGMRAYA